MEIRVVIQRYSYLDFQKKRVGRMEANNNEDIGADFTLNDQNQDSK